MGRYAQAAVVRHCRGRCSFEDVLLDDLQSHEMYVRVVACGICHTDIAILDGVLAYQFPCVLGHEGAGIVEGVGDKVVRFRPGDRVLLSFRSCGKCTMCRSSHPAKCTSFDDLNFNTCRQDGSTTMWDSHGAPLAANFFGQSSFSTVTLTHEQNAISVEATDDELVLFAPLGCGLQAGAGTVLHELRPRRGESIAILGAGAVGFAAMMAAKLMGAFPILVADIVEERLKLAKDLGADFVIDCRQNSLLQAIRKRVGKVSYVVDTTGRSSVINQAMECLEPTGKISLLAIATDDFPLTSPTAQQTVIESCAGDSNPQEFLPYLISMYRDGKFPFDRLIKSYPAHKINTAIKDSSRGLTVKPVLRFS